jgi:hypothetical protein
MRHATEALTRRKFGEAGAINTPGAWIDGAKVRKSASRVYEIQGVAHNTIYL